MWYNIYLRIDVALEATLTLIVPKDCAGQRRENVPHISMTQGLCRAGAVARFFDGTDNGAPDSIDGLLEAKKD